MARSVDLGHGARCYWCDKVCSTFSSFWDDLPVLHMPHEDAPGVMRVHCGECVRTRLDGYERYRDALRAIHGHHHAEPISGALAHETLKGATIETASPSPEEMEADMRAAEGLAAWDESQKEEP